MTHDLKVWPRFMVPLMTREKTFEIRRNDRGFSEGDELTLREWDPEAAAYTGRRLVRRVTFVCEKHDLPDGVGLEGGYCVLGIA